MPSKKDEKHKFLATQNFLASSQVFIVKNTSFYLGYFSNVVFYLCCYWQMPLNLPHSLQYNCDNAGPPVFFHKSSICIYCLRPVRNERIWSLWIKQTNTYIKNNNEHVWLQSDKVTLESQCNPVVYDILTKYLSKYLPLKNTIIKYFTFCL